MPHTPHRLPLAFSLPYSHFQASKALKKNPVNSRAKPGHHCFFRDFIPMGTGKHATWLTRARDVRTQFGNTAV